MNYQKGITKFLTSVFVVCGALSAQNAVADFDPIDPIFEDQFLEVNDIVFSDSTGRISFETSYMNSIELIRRIRIVTASGYEVLIILSPSGSASSIYTPGLDVEITVVSESQIRMRNLNTGAIEYVDRPSNGWPDISTAILPEPTLQWELELRDLHDAYQASIINNEPLFTHPLKKYGDLGLALQYDPPSCTGGECGLDVGLALINVVGWVFGCATVETGFGLAVCMATSAAIPITVGDAITSCSCFAYQRPPVDIIPTEPPPTGVVCNPVCGNWGTSPIPSYVCVETILTIVTVGEYSWVEEVCVRWEPNFGGG